MMNALPSGFIAAMQRLFAPGGPAWRRRGRSLPAVSVAHAVDAGVFDQSGGPGTIPAEAAGLANPFTDALRARHIGG